MIATEHTWQLRIERLGLHRRGDLIRTYGRFVVVIDDRATDLTGFMVEAPGPGDNDTPGNGRRIAAGSYSLTTHYRTFVSSGYSTHATVVADPPMPAIRLLDTGRRTGILIHPVHLPTPKLYVASVGCLNPTGSVEASEDVDFWDSRARVIALIDSLRAFRPEPFARSSPQPIVGASVQIEGEPLDFLPA